ncbi:hypothetical protein HOLleu_02139 [Holothuria leucospilota]|uniref:GIY-YIG domain-containing protein n=1 Tax=Holothuria leucospilota TaxID=206669 RepID=A0A9Q1CRC1_HOLLE|nr:hypothetical protein HOLleu_02139 [Holothuria leucospilota]
MVVLRLDSLDKSDPRRYRPPICYLGPLKISSELRPCSIVGPNNNRFNIHQDFTCTSANVVYVLVCKRCNILYVGETKRRLADQVTEHLRSIKQNLPGFPIATHFNPPSTCSIRDLMVSAAISCRGSDHDSLYITLIPTLRGNCYICLYIGRKKIIKYIRNKFALTSKHIN